MWGKGGWHWPKCPWPGSELAAVCPLGFQSSSWEWFLLLPTKQPPFSCPRSTLEPWDHRPSSAPITEINPQEFSAWSSGVQIIPESMVLAELTGLRTCTCHQCQPERPPIHAQCKEQRVTFLHFSSYLPGLLGPGLLIHRRVRFLTLFQAHASCWHLSCYFSLPKPLISILSFIISILLQTSGLCYSLLF